MNFPTAATQAAPAPAPVSAGGSVAQMAVSLTVVLAVIFALAWLLRWMQRGRAGGTGALRIEAGLQVGAKERVLLIQAGDTHLLVGVAPGRVQTLHVFSEAPVAETAAASPASPFADRLRQLLQKEPAA